MPSLLRHCFAMLRAPANELSFAVRARVRWTRGEVDLPNEAKGALFDWLPPGGRAPLLGRAADLAQRWALERLHARSSLPVYTANLALLENLGRLASGLSMPVAADGVLRAVDIGSGDFHYATALQRWLGRHGARAPREVVLRGFELDGHGVYRDGHSRADHARAHAALATEARGLVRYEVKDALRVRLPEQDVVSIFFPFLSMYPLLRWGLPLSRFAPRRLVARAVATVRPGGWLVVVNQTEAEFRRLQALLRSEPVELVRRVSWATDLVPDAEPTLDQVGSLWRRRFAPRPGDANW